MGQGQSSGLTLELSTKWCDGFYFPHWNIGIRDWRGPFTVLWLRQSQGALEVSALDARWSNWSPKPLSTIRFLVSWIGSVAFSLRGTLSKVGGHSLTLLSVPLSQRLSLGPKLSQPYDEDRARAHSASPGTKDRLR